MKHASMNRIYRLVWNTALGAWVAVAENAKGAGKGGSARRAVLMLATLLALASPASYAVDAANAAVSAGAGSVSTTGSVTTINQASAKLAIDWSKLSTAAHEALVFKQPNAASIALNRVTGGDPSQLLGSLSANGQVFILNPNGILFGATSQVNVGGLVASTLGLGNDDFMVGKFSFANIGANSGANNVMGGTVTNQGRLTAANGGYLALLAPEVRNEGVMTATLGTALLAAGNKVTLKLDAGSLLGYSIDKGAVNALVENGGLIKADGGQVLLTATALDALTTASVNNTGVIEAQTVQNKAGRIVLLGDRDAGTVRVAGTLDASAPSGGNGGFIETSARYVITNESAKITTRAPYGRNGSLLVDPDNFTINNGGPDAGLIGNDSFYSNTFLSNLLENGDVTIQTTGGSRTITVNGPVNWAAGTTLLLQTNSAFGEPGGTININQPITFPNGGLNLLTFGNITVPAAINGNVLTLSFGNWTQIAAALPVLSVKDFRIMPNTDFVDGVKFIRALGGDGSPANPYQLTDIYGVQGMLGDAYNKSFILANPGKNIDASGTRYWYGDDADGPRGFRPIGGYHDFSGSFNGKGQTITGLYINRPDQDYVGLFNGTTGTAAVSNVGLRNVSVIGGAQTGGLAGNSVGTISGSYVTGSVRGFTISTGGLVGENSGTISNSYSTASVRGNNNAGGLVGQNDGTINNSYATGNITTANDYYVGGLVGQNNGALTNTYSSGTVSGGAYLGGLVGGRGNAAATATNSFWDTQKSGRNASDGGTGRNTVQMMTAATFTGWSMNTDGSAPATVWRIYENHTAPLLRSFLTPSALGPTMVTYDGTAQTATSVPPGSNVFGTPATGTNAGSYAGVYWSNQQGYDFSGSASLTINQRPLSVTGGRDYDGTTSISSSNLLLKNLVGGETLGLSGSGSFANKNAGISRPLDIAGLSLADGTGAASNYTFVGGSASVNISRRWLSVSGGRTYDGTTSVSAAGNLTLGNLVGAETLNLGGTALLDDKNARTHTVLETGGLTLANGMNGGLASNYRIDAASPVIVIGPRTLNVTTTGAAKVYDGNTDATVASYGSDKIAGDALSFSNTASTFASKNVGSGVAISVTGISVGGLDAGNYVLAGTTSSTSANITQRTLNVTTTGVNKVYDGNTNAVVNYESDKVAGDTLSFNNSASNYVSKNVGTAIGINVTGISASGLDAGNYVLAGTTSSTSADITQRTLKATTMGVNKVYDGNTNAVVNYDSDKVAADTLSFNNSASNFVSKNVSMAIGINVTGISASGPDAGNYVLADTTSSTSADIKPRTLKVTTTGTNKVYDGNTNAIVTYDSDKVASDTLSFSNNASTFGSKNVGTAISVNVTGISASGPDAGNYVLAGTTSSTSADITPRTLNVKTTGANKVYDGNTNAVVTYDSDKVTGDALIFSSTSRTFASRNVGTGVVISVAGLSASGADAGNYALASSNSSTSANITPQALTVTANNDKKASNGLPYSGGNGVSYNGFVAGDGATNITGTPVYSGSSQGAFEIGAYVITPGGMSSQWGNYALGYSSGTLLITPTAYPSFQGLSSLFNPYACNLQAVKGLGGTEGAASVGCRVLLTPEAMAAQLAATAADNAP